MDERSAATRQPRRSPVVLISLVAIFFVLAAVTVGFHAWKRAHERRHKEYMSALAARGQAYATANGRTDSSIPIDIATGAAPVAREVPASGAAIAEVQWTWSDKSGGSGSVTSIDGCLVTSLGIDVLWQGGDLYVEKEAGALRRVWSSGEGGSSFMAGEFCYVCYDGRFVWAPLVRGGRGSAPRLLVLDPQSEETWEFTDEAGCWEGVSPSAAMEQVELALGPYQPGSVCCARISQHEQWLGVLEFSPPDTRRAKAFVLPALTDLQGGLKEMFSVGRIEAGAAPPLLVLGRRNYPQLVIDPAGPSFSPAKHNSCSGRVGEFTVHDRAFWWTRSRNMAMTLKPLPPSPYTSALYRANFPDLTEQAVLLNVPNGLLIAVDGKLHFLGDRYCRCDPRGTDIEIVEAAPPWQYRESFVSPFGPAANSRPQDSASQTPKPLLKRAFLSSHHGLLVQAAEPNGANQFFAVTMPSAAQAPDSP